MKQVAGWWFPDHEKHLVEWLAHPKNRGHVADGRTMYQGPKQTAAMSFVQNWRTAVDIGGHCGTHSYNLAQRFEKVHAFEPVVEHQRCFAMNVTAANVMLHPCALGDREDMIAIATTNGSSGDSHVSGSGDIPMRTLDSFGLDEVDFIKIDVEGAEELVIRGGLETIRRCRPVMLVEQKGHAGPHFGLEKESALRLLESVGMSALAPPMSGDWIMGWK